VRAIAIANSISVGDFVAPKTKWITTPLSWYERRFTLLSPNEQVKWQSAMNQLRHILSHDDLVGTVIGGLGEKFLTHYDINPNNVFTPENEDTVIFDWEGATLSMPGADLRFLTRLDSRDTLLAVYVSKMAELGIEVETNDIRRAYEMLEGFRMIYKGWAAKSLSAVQRGLAMVSVYILANAPCNVPVTSDTAKNDIEGSKMRKSTSGQATAVLDRQPKSKDPSPELNRKVNEYIEQKGALYAPIAHPAFESMPARWGSERFDLIAPHLDHKGGTALDIGSHWGYMAHRLEDLGYTVTANEHSPKHLYFLTELRDISNKKFKIVPGTVFDLQDTDFDVVIALNIFHHFLKTDERFNAFQRFLGRLKCRTMIYQAHREKERPKLDTAGHYMAAPDMAKFLADRLGLSKVIPIGLDGGREVFKLAK
jgi:2-polyprenyl-3-methyl-5-hydroxy-6-metoxy-1,4-benzoquinol methylase